MKIILGARTTAYDGWIATQQEDLDLTDRASFERYFGDKKASAMLCEHVLEHITLEQAENAAKIIYDYLEDGGYIRVAVPDCNFRNDWYQNYCKVGGDRNPNSASYDHKIFYDYKTLVKVFENAGFKVDLLEYCDENGAFHYKYWNDEDGHICRSFRFDTRNSLEKLGMVSIIIDAKKEITLNDYSN